MRAAGTSWLTLEACGRMGLDVMAKVGEHTVKVEYCHHYTMLNLPEKIYSL